MGELDNGLCMLVKEDFSEVGECSLKVMTFVDSWEHVFQEPCNSTCIGEHFSLRNVPYLVQMNSTVSLYGVDQGVSLNCNFLECYLPA